MKKTMIALAVAAAMPVAAQADVTLSGDASVKFTLGANNMTPVIDTNFNAASSEVLTNGMTATASFNILGAEANNATVGLSGDFGSVTAGSAEGTDLTTTDNGSDTMKGVSYTGTFADLTVNAASGNYNRSGVTTGDDYVSYGASMDFNGLAVAASNTNDVTSISATYTLGDITLTADKDSDDENATVKAAYSATMGDLAVSLVAQSAPNSTADTTWDLDATYTMGDIALTLEDAENEEPQISATYSSGALSVTVDDESNVEVAYDMGNADILVERDSSAASGAGSTTVKYTVSF